MNLFALIAVAIAAVTMSFNLVTKSESKVDDLIWFQINAEVQKTDTQAIDPSEATHLPDGPASGSGCNNGSYQCVSGFRPDQVSGTTLSGSQVPEDVAMTKN